MALLISSGTEWNHHGFNLRRLLQPTEQGDQVTFADGVAFHHLLDVGGEIATHAQPFDQLGVTGVEVALLVSDEADDLEIPAVISQLICQPCTARCGSVSTGLVKRT